MNAREADFRPGVPKRKLYFFTFGKGTEGENPPATQRAIAANAKPKPTGSFFFAHLSKPTVAGKAAVAAQPRV
jgi:hypothetical protein